MSIKLIEKLKFTKPKLAIFLFSVFVGSGAITYLLLTLADPRFSGDVKESPVIAQGEFIAQPSSDVLNFLLLGHGGPGHQGGSLMDSIIVLSIDTKNKKAVMVSVPRDLWIEGRKINEGFTAGGYDLLKHEVSTVTGIFPDNYIAIDFDAFVRAVNQLGGVDAQISKRYEDAYYPIRGRENETCGKSAEEFAKLHQKYSGYQLEIQFECRYEHIVFEPGVKHMDGDTALKYVRSRHGDGDFGRSERQFVILNAMLDKIISLEVLKNFGPVFDNLMHFVDTNMDVSQIKGIAQFLTSPKDYQLTSLHLTDANVLRNAKGSSGQFILLSRDGVDVWSGVRAYIKSEYDKN